MRRAVTPAVDRDKNFELVRSGFFADGRFYSIEVSPHGYGWEARIVCVPGEKLESAQTVKLAGYKQELRRWAERLSVEEIQALAEGCG